MARPRPGTADTEGPAAAGIPRVRVQITSARSGDKENRHELRATRRPPRTTVDVENALLRAAVGDYADEAAVLLLITFGHWLPQLQSARRITLEQDVDGRGRGLTGTGCRAVRRDPRRQQR